MSRFLDARVPVRFALGHWSETDWSEPDTAWLIQGDGPAPHGTPTGAPTGTPAARFHLPPIETGHPPGCRCCLPRGPVAEALSRLFLARVRGEVAFFKSVTALPLDQAGAETIRAALATDPMLVARFRLD